MIKRKGLAPNNRFGAPLNELMGGQFAKIKYPKSIEEPRIVTQSSPGRGQQGEPVSGGTYRQNVIRKQHNTRAN
jgi:hypothetical protein